jgi:hypothetical protein
MWSWSLDGARHLLLPRPRARAARSGIDDREIASLARRRPKPAAAAIAELVRRRGIERASEVLVRWLAEGVRSALDQVSSYSAFSTADFDRYIDENGIPEEDYPAAFVAERTGARCRGSLAGGT